MSEVKWSNWLNHDGSKRPVRRDCLVEIEFRNGEIRSPRRADYWVWGHENNNGDIVKYRYRIEESDMHPGLEWLARNTKPRQFGQISVRRDSDFHIGYQWSDRRRAGDGWHHYSEVDKARQQLGLTTPGISDEGEEECLNLAHERMADNREKYSPYFKDVSHLDRIDVYRVVSLFDCEKHGHAISHAVKKLLLTGVRTGGKDVETEVREAIDSLNRWMEMREEDK